MRAPAWNDGCPAFFVSTHLESTFLRMQFQSSGLTPTQDEGSACKARYNGESSGLRTFQRPVTQSSRPTKDSKVLNLTLEPAESSSSSWSTILETLARGSSHAQDWRSISHPIQTVTGPHVALCQERGTPKTRKRRTHKEAEIGAVDPLKPPRKSST